MTRPTAAPPKACVFDAYGTLFDVAAAARESAAEIGHRWQPLADLWRQKQLQYTWLRGLMGQHADFWQVTGDALDFALASLQIEADAELRQKLMDLYLRLSPYPETRDVLARLKSAGVKLAILSNGSPRMLEAAVGNAGIADLLDGVYSVESVGVYKPHPSVYRLAVDGLGLPPDAMSFQSSNAWDAWAAKCFGYRVCWINRFGQQPERLPWSPDAEISSLHDLPAALGVQSP